MATVSSTTRKSNQKQQDFNLFADEYAQYRQIDPPVLDDLITTGKLNAEARILEVGCGTGNYLRALAAQTKATCYGIDPAERMLSQAIAHPNPDGVHWLLGDAQHLQFPDETFDLVYSVDVCHHIPHRLRYFQEALRVLKPGGKICTVTDSEWIISHREPLATFFPETIDVNLRRYPTVTELMECKQAAGFKGVAQKMTDHTYILQTAAGYKHKAYSSLHLINEAAFQQGVARLEAALSKGPMVCHSYYLLIWGEKAV